MVQRKEGIEWAESDIDWHINCLYCAVLCCTVLYCLFAGTTSTRRRSPSSRTRWTCSTPSPPTSSGTTSAAGCRSRSVTLYKYFCSKLNIFIYVKLNMLNVVRLARDPMPARSAASWRSVRRWRWCWASRWAVIGQLTQYSPLIGPGWREQVRHDGA